MNLSDEFETAIEQSSRAASVDRIETRSCASDNFDGVEHKIYGDFITIQPIIETVATEDGLLIEQLYCVSDGPERHVGVFVVEKPEFSHPAFVR